MREVDPTQTGRAQAFALWMQSPMPMVTLLKELDVTNLVRLHRRRGYKFHMLMCWCIGRAAMQTKEFYLLPVGNKLMQYDALAVNTVVNTKDGRISTCDLPLCADLQQFAGEYARRTKQVQDTGVPYELGDDYMVIGTSALAQYEIAGAINQYTGLYHNPFLIWGKYRKHFLKATLTISFQFHHTQMDGMPAARFLDCLQKEIRELRG